MSDNDLEKQLGVKIRKDELINRVHFYVYEEDLPYTEAILEVCDEYGIEPEDIAKLITGPLKERLRIEAVRMNTISDSKASTKANGYIKDCT